MAKVILRQKAIDDLNNIWVYSFEKWSENQANKYYSLIKYAFNEIGKNPSIGKVYTEISENLCGIKSGKHILFYQLISGEEIEVIRILHESMDLKTRMFE